MDGLNYTNYYWLPVDGGYAADDHECTLDERIPFSLRTAKLVG
jgi:hypothetical protein